MTVLARIAAALTLALVAWVAPLRADDNTPTPAEFLESVPALPREAILRYARTDLEEWHYVRTRVSEEGVIVDRHDPTQPGEAHWQLVSIDGRAPTREEIEDYEDERADHSKDDEKARGEEIARVLDPGTVRLVGQEGAARRFSLGLRSPDGKRERVFRALAGELEVVPGPTAHWVREVRVWNQDTLRPYLGVRIDEADLVFRFTLKDGWVLPAAVEARWSGEFLMLKDIGKQLRFTLTDFRRVGSTTAEMTALP